MVQEYPNTKLLLVVLFTFHADIHNLEDVVVGTQLQIAHVDLGVITQEILCKLSYFLWPGCAPHQCLPIRLPGKEKPPFRVCNSPF